MAKENEKIKKNTKSISIVNRRLDRLEQTLSGELKVPSGFAVRPNYSFVFGGTPFELGVAQAATAAGTWIPFEGCDDFYENTTGKTQTVTITIKNTSDLTMDVDIDGTKKTSIDSGKTKTIIVEIPAGKSLHADQNGEYLA